MEIEEAIAWNLEDVAWNKKSISDCDNAIDIFNMRCDCLFIFRTNKFYAVLNSPV
jgi:hypothetical protein